MLIQLMHAEERSPKQMGHTLGRGEEEEEGKRMRNCTGTN